MDPVVPEGPDLVAQVVLEALDLGRPGQVDRRGWGLAVLVVPASAVPDRVGRGCRAWANPMLAMASKSIR